MLNSVSYEDMETLGFVVEVGEYYLRVSPQKMFDVVVIEFFLEEPGHLDGQDCYCQLQAGNSNMSERSHTPLGGDESTVDVAIKAFKSQV